MKNFLVIGAGMIGQYIAQDLIKYGAVTLADFDLKKEALAKKIGARFEQVDVTNHNDLVRLMQGKNVSVSAVQRPEHHYLGLLAAIDAGCNFTDLGADPTTLKKEFALQEKARNAGIIAIPDTGASPGITNVLIGMGDRKLDKTKYIHYFVGAIPLNPTNPPLNYSLVFSVAVLVNEYFEKSEIIKNGKIQTVEGLSGLEQRAIPGFGTLEGAFVAGQTSTLTQTYLGEVDELYEKTLRYPGHYAEMKKLEKQFPDRKDLEAYLLKILPKQQKDVFLVEVVVGGEKDGKQEEVKYSIAHKYNEATNTTATAEATAWPAAIIANMIANGKITKKGVCEQEKDIPDQEFVDQLTARGMKITAT